MLSKHLAMISKGKIIAIIYAYPPHKLTKNQIPLTYDEYLFLKQFSVTDGIDLQAIMKIVRIVDKKIKGLSNGRKRNQNKEE